MTPTQLPLIVPPAPPPTDTIRLYRAWCMPSQWTFQMPPVRAILERYVVEGFVDPFAGMYSPASLTNDIEGRGALFAMDGLDFLRSLPSHSAPGALFDPPYSVEQCLRNYTPKHNGTAGRVEYWAQCKDEITRIVAPGGVVISCGWDSTGIGISRGFTIEEVWLLCHGACHYDTIITIDRKRKDIVCPNVSLTSPCSLPLPLLPYC